MKMKRKRIIFVCKHNRFRSKVAEAYFKKKNKNRKIKAKASSGGIFKGYPVAETVVKIGRKLGIRISKKTRGLREDELVKADKIIIVANDLPKENFSSKRFKNKVILWKIPDTSQDNEKNIEKIMKQIMKKVDSLKV